MILQLLVNIITKLNVENLLLFIKRRRLKWLSGNGNPPTILL